MDIDEKLKLLVGSKSRAYLTDIIKRYNDYCKENDLKEQKLKGYSKFKKGELLDFILSNLSEEEKEKIFLKKEDEYVKDLIESGLAIINGEDKVDKLIKVDSDGNTHRFLFKGFTWENKTYIELGKKKNLDEHGCDCRIADNGGYCKHLFAGLIRLSKDNLLDLSTLPVNVSEDNLKLIGTSSTKKKITFSPDSDIILSPDYEISVNGTKVTMKWGGERAGISTKDIAKEAKPKKGTKTSESDIDVELWVAKKVVDKILAPLKREGLPPRKIIKDEIKIIEKIMNEEKLVDKLLKAFNEKQALLNQELPSNKNKLETFLKADL